MNSAQRKTASQDRAIADVIIVGGGFCGVTVAKSLLRSDPRLAITLIEEHCFFEFIPGLPRAITDPQVLKNLQRPYKQIVPGVRHIIARVQAFTAEGVSTSKGMFRGQCYVLCSGASYPVPLQSKNVFFLRKGDQAEMFHKKLASAAAVLVVGGGLTGVELAAELVAKTKVKVTLVEPGSRILGRCPERASRLAYNFITTMSGRVLLGERIEKLVGRNAQLSSGARVPADLVLWCGGLGWDTRWLQVAHQNNQRGALVVNEFLQLADRPNVFCGGDLSAIDEEKSAQNAEHQGAIIAHNVACFLRKEPLKKYTPAQRPMIISLGDWNGIIVMKSFALGGLIPALLKRCIEKWFLFKMRWL